VTRVTRRVGGVIGLIRVKEPASDLGEIPRVAGEDSVRLSLTRYRR